MLDGYSARRILQATDPNKSRKAEVAVLLLHSLPKIPPRYPVPALKPTYYVPVTAALRSCPECTGPLSWASGCVSCVYCGWGKCG
jgi:hypothetical protein